MSELLNRGLLSVLALSMKFDFYYLLFLFRLIKIQVVQFYVYRHALWHDSKVICKKCT